MCVPFQGRGYTNAEGLDDTDSEPSSAGADAAILLSPCHSATHPSSF